jgi:hypothetical protein
MDFAIDEDRRRGLLKLIHGNYLIYYRIQEQKKGCRNRSLQHGGRDQVTVPDGNQKQASLRTGIQKV